MLEFPRWKYFLIALVLLASAFYALPNVFPTDPAVQVAAGRGVVVDDALATRVRGELEKAKVAYASVAKEGDDLIVRVADADAQTRASETLGLALGEDYTVALKRAATAPEWLAAMGAKPMTLGLDLQGGVHFLLEVDQAAAREKREDGYVEEVRVLLRDNDVSYKTVVRDADGMLVTLAKAEDRARALNLIAQSLPQLVVAGDSGGEILRLTVSPQELQKIANDAIEQNITTLRNRVAALGEPVIQRQGTSRIIVELPGVQDPAGAKEKIGGTATLEWRAVVEGNPLTAMESGVVPPDARLYFRRPEPGQPADQRIPILLSKRVIVSGDQLVDAIPGIDPQTGSPDVSIKLDSAGGKRMRDHTLDNVGKRMAIVYIESRPVTRIIDGKPVNTTDVTEEVINDATIQGVFGSNFHTTGLEAEESKRLSQQIKSGALAAPMVFAEERVIGPSLGAENVRRGMFAVLASFGFVMVFFLVYYKMFGIITNLALLLNLLLVVAFMSIFGADMTLPGFAGIALTVGMSVDANVLINERIREELRLGLTPLASIAAGYDKASGTIADANVTALLGGMAMAAFGSGPIRGFGITLIIGILTSMYTAVEVSRGIATLIYGRRRKLASLSI